MGTAEALVVLLLTLWEQCAAICSPEYGGLPCKFIPSVPGRTPSCARPGLTYCEHPSHYPGQLIHYLIEKWRYDYKTLLSNESPEEFNSYFIPDEAKYGPKPVYGPPNSLHDFFTPEPIHIPKPLHPSLRQPGNAYIPPHAGFYHNFSDGFAGYHDSRPYHSQEQGLPTNQIHNFQGAKAQVGYNPHVPQYYSQSSFYPSELPHAAQYNSNDWGKRYVRDLQKRLSEARKRRRRSPSRTMVSKNSLNGNFTNSSDVFHGRKKRQNAITGQPLCQSRSQYIMPRAALNNKGNWMYVVNMPEVDSRYTQLVKSETCISQQCNGLCALPTGYTARCEQKYIQKRLVALEGSGEQLYTDVFWFPSCCVCTISN